MNLIFGVGFTAEYVVRIITERGSQNISSIYLFSVWSEDEFRRKQTENAIKSITDFLSVLNIKYVTKYIDINKEFEEIVLEVASTLSSLDDLEFYLIGGMRIINLALYYYALICKNLGKNVRVFSYTEDISKKYNLPAEIPSQISEKELEVLKEFKFEKEMEIEEVAKRLDKALTTISRQISDLEEKGYLECIKTKPKKCKLSKLGEIMIKIK